MTIREAKTIINEMHKEAEERIISEHSADRYEALGVALEAIEHWIDGEHHFPESSKYIKMREKGIEGAEKMAEYKGKCDDVLHTYIYDAGFADCWRTKIK